MRFRACLTLCALLLASNSMAFEATLTPVSQARYKHFGIFHLFDATYSTEVTNRSAEPLGDFPKSLRFVYKRKLTRQQLIDAANKILPKANDPATLRSISSRLNTINEAYVDVNQGDSYTLTYSPQKGTTLSLNGLDLATIAGSDFQAVYFSIWLSTRSPFAFRPIDS